MPSERTDSLGLSASSYFCPEDMHFPDERQVRVWKTGTMPNYYGSKVDGMLQTSIDSSPLEKRMALNSQISKSSELADPYHKQGLRANLIMEKHVAGVAGPASRSLPRALEHDLGARCNFNMEPSYFMEGNKLNLIGTQGENSLFSSSLSELFSRKLRLSSSNNMPYGHSVGAAASQYEEEEPFESLEELEAQTIGNLLPDDDDLFSGVTDGIDYINPPNNVDDIEDLDVFSSIGGMDLGDDGLQSGQSSSDFSGANSNGLLGASVGGEHPFGEHPSRTLFVRNINSNVEDSELRSLFEDNPSEKDINQGTLVIFNLDSSVSNEDLHQIFGVCGEIKEIRETPHRSHHKFIEFYDVRAAEAALRALNRSDIAGKRIKLEPSRPGGARRLMQPFSSEMDLDESSPFLQQTSPPSSVTTGFSAGTFPHSAITSGIDNETIYVTHSASGTAVTPLLDSGFRHAISSSVPNSVPSLTKVGSVGNQSNVSESPSRGEMKFEFHTLPSLHPHSLPDYRDRIGNGVSRNPSSAMSSSMSARASEVIENHKLNESVFAPGNGSCPPPGRHYMWSNTHHPQPQGMIWPNSPSFVSGVCTGHPQQLHMVPRASNQLLNGLLPISNHQVGSAPSVNPSVWDGRHAYAGESPDTSVFHPGSLGNIRISGSSPHPLEFVPRNIFPGAGGNCMDLPVPSKSVGFNSHPQRCMMFPARGQMIPMMNTFDSPTERSRSRRNESSSSQADNKKQFELDIDRIVRGDDKRTTLMIKNIPNKYTSKMLLAAIDERHRGTYDFIYLPIDFKNKCNVGYAFINMTDPSLIIPFYQAFNGKKWEKFNSEKVASLAYARIQGKSALIAHFQNSSLMNEDKRCRPILFHTDGPNAGDQVPFPMGVNVRSRPGKNRTSNIEENIQEGSQNLPNGEISCNGDETAGTVKESD